MTTTTPSRLRCGILGCSEFAARRMVPAMAAADRIELVAVSSRSAETARRFACDAGCEPVVGYDALLARPDIDAVYLPLPIALHARWVRRALAAGKHVLAEKPLATDPDDVSALTAQARAAGLVLMENALFTHHPVHAEVRDHVASGVVGALREFSATFTIPHPGAADIRLAPELGGGALLDVGFYPVRAALLFLGELRVLGARAVHDARTGVDLATTALLETSDGVPVHLHCGIDHSYEASYSFRGTDGVATVHRAYTPPADLAPDLLVRRGPGDLERLSTCAADQVGLALRRFADRTLDGESRPDDAADDPNRAFVHPHAVLVDRIRRSSGR